MASTSLDYYQTLEISRDADGATIKSSYRKLAMKFQPGSQSGRCRGGGQVQGAGRGV